MQPKWRMLVVCVGVAFHPTALVAQADIVRGRVIAPDNTPVERATITVTSLRGSHGKLEFTFSERPRMRTPITTAVLGLIFLATSADAQSSPKTGASSVAAAPSFIGDWEGAYQTDHGPNGPMSMRISKDSAWKATAEVISGSQTIPTRISNVSVEDNTIAWTQEIMGMSCKTTAVLDGQDLKGSTECEHGSMTIALRKK